MSVNISRTGLLFSTSDVALSRGDEIDFLIHLPAIEGAARGEARCTGRVARVVLPSEGSVNAVIGVTIDRYVLTRESGLSTQVQRENGERE